MLRLQQSDPSGLRVVILKSEGVLHAMICLSCIPILRKSPVRAHVCSSEINSSLTMCSDARERHLQT